MAEKCINNNFSYHIYFQLTLLSNIQYSSDIPFFPSADVQPSVQSDLMHLFHRAVKYFPTLE